MKKIKLLALPLLLSMTMVACKKDFLTTAPSYAVPESELFSTTAKMQLYLDGLYKKMFTFSPYSAAGRHDDFGPTAYQLASDLMGNDMVVNTQGYGWFNAAYQYTEWAQATANRHPDLAWRRFYGLIGGANRLITVADASAGTQAEKENIKGQAYGMRAYGYFMLINYFQQTYKGNETAKGVPLYDKYYEVLPNVGRGTVQQVYDMISADLAQAETLLNGKTRASKVAVDVTVVRGLQARVALIKEDWATAATKANAARQGYTLMTAPQYQAGFSQISNPEWMWGSLIPSAEATIYASFFSHMDISTGGYAALGGQKKITKALFDQIQTGDVRKTVFKSSGATTANPLYNQLKFRVPTAGSWAADYLYMRAAEMYLIEAEALARQGQDANARTVLQTLVQARYPAYSAAAFSGTNLINEVLLQRRIELWGEGFALMDIKRLKNGLNRPTGADNHGSPNFNPSVYTTAATDARFIMKIPQAELDTNPAIPASDQNP